MYIIYCIEYLTLLLNFIFEFVSFKFTSKLLGRRQARTSRNPENHITDRQVPLVVKSAALTASSVCY